MKKKEILKELQSNFNLILLDDNHLEGLVNLIQHSYKKSEHHSVTEFIKSVSKTRELSKDEIIESLKLENMELKANLDGISLSFHIDENGVEHYAPASNPYAKEVLSRDGDKISKGIREKSWFNHAEQIRYPLIKKMRAGNNFKRALNDICEEYKITESLQSLQNSIPRWAKLRIDHGKKYFDFKKTLMYKWAKEFIDLKNSNHNKRTH